MKKIFVFLFVICIFQIGYSQKDFRQGYIITKKGDRMNGFVKYRQGAKKYESCDFKKSKDEDAVSYSPDQIKGYGIIDDFYFESRTIANEENIIENVFIEVLVEGKATLYNYRGLFYVKKKDAFFRRLDNSKREIVINGKKILKNSNRYIGSLTYLFSDCQELKGKIKKVLFNEKSLTRIFELYNNCSNESSITYKANKKWFKLNFSLMASYFISSLKFTPTNPDDERNLNSDFNVPNEVAPGFNIHFSSPRINERVSFQIGLLYLNSTYTSFNDVIFPMVTTRNDIILDLEQLKIPLGIRYTFSKKTITPYTVIGISNTIHLNHTSTWKQEIEFNNIVQTSEDLNLDLTENQFGYWIAFGIKKSIFNKIDSFLEFRYEYSSASAVNNTGALVPYDIPSFQISLGLSN